MTATELLVPQDPLSIAPLPDVLTQLAQVHADRPLVVSLYLRLGVQDRIRNRYRIAARDAVRRARDVVESSDLSHADSEALARDLFRVESYLGRAGGLPHSAGLALFACESVGLFQVLALPRVLQTRLLLGQRPRLAEALAATEGFGRIMVALVDRALARFFEVTAFGVTELAGLHSSASRGGKFHPDREDSPGWGERAFHGRLREEHHRHAVAVARRLTGLVGSGGCQGIVLAGAARSIAEQRRFLPRELARRILGSVRLNPTAATEAEVRDAALEVSATWERGHQAAILAELEQGVGTGWAVNGPRATLRALDRGQVRLLLVPAGQMGSGYRYALSGRLALARGDRQGEGEPIPIPDLVSEVVDEALQQRVDVEVIDDPGLKRRVDGLAAMLRFR
jgi:peptide chain release factor subunit 1